MEWIFMCKEVVLTSILWLLVYACFENLLRGGVSKKDINFEIFMGSVVAIIAGIMTWESVVKAMAIVQTLG